MGRTLLRHDLSASVPLELPVQHFGQQRLVPPGSGSSNHTPCAPKGLGNCCGELRSVVFLTRSLPQLLPQLARMYHDRLLELTVQPSPCACLGGALHYLCQVKNMRKLPLECNAALASRRMRLATFSRPRHLVAVLHLCHNCLVLCRIEPVLSLVVE